MPSAVEHISDEDRDTCDICHMDDVEIFKYAHWVTARMIDNNDVVEAHRVATGIMNKQRRDDVQEIARLRADAKTLRNQLKRLRQKINKKQGPADDPQEDAPPAYVEE